MPLMTDAPGPVPDSSPGWRHMFRALRSRDFRLFFIGQTISLIGTWMQQTALPWLVYSLTDSAVLLGLVSFCTMIPVFVLGPVAGVVADRWQRRSLMLATQVIAMLQALLLGLSTWFGWIDATQILLLAILGGCAWAFNIPVAQAFLSDIVPREDLPSAIALNAALTNLARMIGPALAGGLIAFAGEGRQGETVCFLGNGVSYVAVLACLWLIQPTLPSRPVSTGSLIAPLKEGFVAVAHNAILRDLWIVAALIGLVGTPVSLMPVFARQLAGDDASALGILMATTGLGALVGAIYVASRRGLRGSGKRIAIGSAFLGLSLIGFAYAPSLGAAAAWRFVSGVALVVQLTSCSTVVQTVTDDDKRGRVLSLFSMAFLGMSPLGNLAAGFLANMIGAAATFSIYGISCLLVAVAFAARLPALRVATHMDE